MSISAKDVKALRDQTGAGMMDCKKALSESNGDMEKAIEYLRKKGQKLSEKRADREANEGVVIALTSENRNKGVVVRLSCETDFVSKNDDFVNLTKQIAQIALDNMPADLDALKALPFGDISIGEKAIEQTGVIGEKIELSDYGMLETAAGDGQVVPYIHMGNRAGVIVALNQEGPELVDAGRNVAMQVAAMKPIAVDKDGIDSSVVEKEIEIGKEIARKAGKPEEMLQRIAEGKLNKFFKEKTLLNQQYVRGNKESVSDYLNTTSPNLSVTGFVHIALG